MVDREEKGETILRCEACGTEFNCGARNGVCWCFDISLHPDSLEDLRKKYKNCLCADCLKNKIKLLLPD